VSEMAATLLRRLLAIPPGAASFSALGFGDGGPCDAGVRGRLERVLEVFLAGYNLALATGEQEELAAELRGRFDDHHVGFAFEGAGMAFAMLDLATECLAVIADRGLEIVDGDRDVIDLGQHAPECRARRLNPRSDGTA